jgi:hypothetical protein
VTLANTASTLLGTFGVNVTAVITTLDGKVLAPHINADIAARHFGRGSGFLELQRLQQLAQRGVNIAVEFGGELISELEFGNYASTVMHGEAFYKKVIDDLKQGKALAISKQAALQYLSQRLRVAPVELLMNEKINIDSIMTYLQNKLVLLVLMLLLILMMHHRVAVARS